MGAAHGCETVDDASDRASVSHRRTRSVPRLSPDPTAVDAVSVDKHLDTLHQLRHAEREKYGAAVRLEEADRATKITNRLVDQLQQEADRLRAGLTETENALARSREECSALARAREVAELEREQLRADLAQAREALRSAMGGGDSLRQQLGIVSSERDDLKARLERKSAEESSLRAACAQLEQSKIEQWLLHDSSVMVPLQQGAVRT